MWNWKFRHGMGRERGSVFFDSNRDSFSQSIRNAGRRKKNYDHRVVVKIQLENSHTSYDNNCALWFAALVDLDSRLECFFLSFLSTVSWSNILEHAYVFVCVLHCAMGQQTNCTNWVIKSMKIYEHNVNSIPLMDIKCNPYDTTEQTNVAANLLTHKIAHSWRTADSFYSAVEWEADKTAAVWRLRSE